jgi:hypothetical protein
MLALSKRLLFFTLLVLFLAACSSAQPSASPTGPSVTATQAVQPVLASLTPLPPQPTRTPPPPLTATAAPSPTPTVTLTPTTDPFLASAKLIGVGWRPGYNLLLSIQFPGPVQPEDYRVMIEEKEEYTCEVIAQHPDRLYCIGRGRNVYGRITVQIFPAGSQSVGFEGRISVPYFTE